MKNIHIECLPDEYLVKKLGFTRKYITHHQGKSRVFYMLTKMQNQLAMVDEDPGCPKTHYEKNLIFQGEFEGIKYYSDNLGNKILFLNGKLEDWIINICRIEKINLSVFGLPDSPDNLHDQINMKLSNFESLLTKLIENKNPALLKLKTLLT